ncbi:DUF6268 family outer membrane beta-barrel protein [Mangrovibacterium diazotrophicum]|uniref:DUF6268 domain-containing protein n=1 Tax=Mangrovibacterium diazotrophicum TaxID=1261403 RepID=A0A419W476_9BACT|nr:DUF6268 family outer membrane beta-barrel protein [Mangrovibacterium diazotrophicum]RKD90245.1 hypothetical protein BC643_0581 [Mangrovibacterium diazotrophicum]
MKQLFQIVCLLLLFPLAGYSQSLSVFSADFVPTRGKSEIGASGDIQLAFPVLRRQTDQLVLAPRYQFLNLDDGFPFSEQRFYELSLNTVWRHTINESWSWVALIMPAFSSSTDELSMNSFVWTSGLSFTRLQNRHFSYRLGVIYANRFKSNLIVPMLGFHWIPNDHFELNADLPMRLRVQWLVAGGLKMGLVASSNRQISHVSGYADFDYLWFREQNLSWFTDLRMIRKWWLSCQAGYSFKRELKLYQKPEQATWEVGANLTPSKVDPFFEYADEGFFLKVGIAYQLTR